MTIVSDRPYLRATTRSAPLLLALVLLLGIGRPVRAQPSPSSTPEAASTESLYGRDIAKVEIVGLRAVAERKVLEASVLREGRVLTREAESTTLAALYRLGFFQGDIRIDARPADEPNKAVVVITLRENPLIERIAITGNSQVKLPEIETGLPFDKGDVVPTNVEGAAREAIEAVYAKRGYTKVSVAVERTELPDNAVALTIRIDEGTRLRIGDIVYVGNHSVSRFRLNLTVATKGSWLFIDNYLDRKLFEADLEAVRDYYASVGFLDAKVSEGASKYSADGKSVDLVVAIDEGPRYTLDEVRFDGATLFTTSELLEPFQRLLGQPLDRAAALKAIESVRKLYGDSGWILTSLEPNFDKAEQGAGAVLTLQIDEAQRIRVGAIKRTERELDIPESEFGPLSRLFSRIAPPVKDEVVLRQIRLQSGEVYRQSDQERSLRNLRSLRVFKSVKIEHEPASEPGVRNVNVLTETGNTGFLLLQGGVGSSDGAFARVQLTERNLFGEARAASIAATLGSDTRGLSVSYLDRDFLQSNKEFLVRVFVNEYSRRGYDEQDIGTSLRLGTELAENLTEYWRLRLSSVSIDPDDDVVADLNDYILAAVGYGRELDLRDDTRNPTSGYKLAGDIDLGVADTAFVKLTGSYEWYRELFGGMVYSLDLRGGILPLPSDRDDLGIGERFFLGGANDLRGFRFRGAGPKDTGDDSVALGGLTKLLVRNEVAIPVGVESLRALLFVDAGSLDEDAFALDSPRLSTGFGLRYRSNALDAEIDFGFALVDKSHDDTQVFHFLLESGI